MIRHFNRGCVCILTALIVFVSTLSGCTGVSDTANESETEPDISTFLVSLEDKPDTEDFQCTTLHYTVALNSFNRLVEMENNAHGSSVVFPSLARKWEVSDDGFTYTFHLREGVTFSNGSPLTSSDVQYSFERLLTHPDSCNKDIVEIIHGAKKLEHGKTDHLDGFTIIDDLTFKITLKQPFEAFLACLSMPAASILDEETTKKAGDRFGTDPEWTIGTGPFILWKWDDDRMLLKANPNCWNGVPKCQGLDLRFTLDPDEIEAMLEKREIDIVDLERLGSDGKKYMNNDTYKDNLFRAHPVGINYIALNESIKPLDNPSVRKALQLALDRKKIVKTELDGNAQLENGILPHGLYGFNENLPAIPFKPKKAAKLLANAGFADGFDMTISAKSSSANWELETAKMIAAMWKKIGVRASVEILDEDEWMDKRKNGQLACYFAGWVADYNDPDNFMYTFFGNKDNTTFRSLCYPNNDIMKRVRMARTITDRDRRLKEYRDLERIIVLDDAAWIPLCSRLRFYIISDRLDGIRASWNGSIKNNYRNMSIKGTAQSD